MIRVYCYYATTLFNCLIQFNGLFHSLAPPIEARLVKDGAGGMWQHITFSYYPNKKKHFVKVF